MCPLPVETASVDRLLSWLDRLQREDCIATRGALRKIIDEIVEHVDTYAADHASIMDCGKLSALFEFGPKGTRRDEDVKEFVTDKMVKKRRVHSASQALRVITEGDTSAGICWEQKLCHEALLQSRESLLGSSIVWVAEDAARTAKPGEDLNVYLLWDSASGFGVYPPPQVLAFTRSASNILGWTCI